MMSGQYCILIENNLNTKKMLCYLVFYSLLLVGEQWVDCTAVIGVIYLLLLFS